MPDYRIKPSDVADNIIEEKYTTLDKVFPDSAFASDMSRTVICGMVLKNGMVVVSSAAATHVSHSDPAKGREAARAKAVDQVYGYLGYDMRTKITAEESGGDS